MDQSKPSPRNNPFLNVVQRVRGQSSEESYAPPSGPPPSQQAQYAPPPGPPPSYHEEQDRAPRPSVAETETHAPPPGPPPFIDYSDSAPPYHDWQSAVPDTTLLPPPPSFGYEFSPTSNASDVDAQRGQIWCEQNPLLRPHQPLESQVAAVRNGNVALQKPPGYRGSIRAMGAGRWEIRTKADSADTCFISTLPLFFEMVDSPLRTEVSKTIYYEIKVKSLLPQKDGSGSAAAIGFCAVPYPTFRMPGWERASLAIHSDDGHRYVNDNEGGRDFTSPIEPGETVGLGMTFSCPKSAASPVSVNVLQAEVFFTRNGQRAGGWNLEEQLDETNQLGAFGVDGKYDLFAAVGVFGKVSIDVMFSSRDWLWKP